MTLGRGKIKVEDKYTGEVLAELPLDYRRDLREKINQAYLAKGKVRKLSLEERLGLIQAVGKRLEAERELLVEQLIKEAGQARKFATFEVERTLKLAQNFGLILDLVRPQKLPAAAGANVLMYEPFGVVGIMAPRNVPLLVPFYTLFCSFGGGNAAVIKPSSATPLSTQRLIDHAQQAGFPKGTVAATTCAGEDVAWEFVENPKLDVFMIYSSSPVGKDNIIKMGRYLEGTKRILGECLLSVEGKMKKYVPELAGNDPFIVLPGADMERTVEAAVLGGFANAGQLCISAKRFIVHQSLMEEFRHRLCRGISQLKVGDPNLPDTDIGPLGRQATLNLAIYQVEEAQIKGGRIICGGNCEEPFFYPTVIEFDKEQLLGRDLEEKPFLWAEESFAPLRSLVAYDREEEALALANDCSYGLGASIFGPAEAAQRVAAQLEAGRIMINESPLYGDPYLPIGGIKDSGLYGSTHKIQELVYMKRVHVGG
jgi:acyl-CoA reductase-like NAD-dependent aldehyde dehydrogenase